ncbi:TRAP transporter small permease subunit [Marinobacterium sp. D7]|uniref:TRAP transporter small permease subunit n=1 Tax=Marinobacterium ramblicola TaxID=2849041 RepID=UPI001C2DEFDE|nr:TRAP transporter small permease subunit [Marinobacterium ramblicola]MBV1788989.1 TRAP transporter small permease subunit [Marinobacterium ramblicola]
MKLVIDRLEWLVELLGGLARWCVLALVLLVAVNVLLRYLFSIGPVALQELEWHLVSPIALLGLAYSMKHRADVRVDFLYDRFGRRGQAAVDIVAALLTLAIGFIITWLSIPYVTQSFQLLEGSPDPGGLPYRYLLKTLIPLGFALLVLQGIADALRSLMVFVERPIMPSLAAGELLEEGAS